MILTVVGARPNLVKVAPVVDALVREGLSVEILHTGQHYDHALSGSFFDALEMPSPTYHLGVGSGTHAEQTAGVLVGVERILTERRFDLVLVPGDVNSTLAAALAAAKTGVPVAHLEAGLRSGDWSMPEEINRVVTDRLSDLLLCPSEDAVENLAREGVERGRIELVGNTMIDSLLRILPAAQASDALTRLDLEPRRYVLVTLHRPSLVDDPGLLLPTLEALADAARDVEVVIPVHPRTRRRLAAAAYAPPAHLRLLEPLEYLDFIAVQASSAVVVTDSGGVQEEASVLGVRCLTYRTTTERPITVTHGTNRVIGTKPEVLRAELVAALGAVPPASPEIPLWDGEAGGRCATAIAGALPLGSSPACS